MARAQIARSGLAMLARSRTEGRVSRQSTERRTGVPCVERPERRCADLYREDADKRASFGASFCPRWRRRGTPIRVHSQRVVTSGVACLSCGPLLLRPTCRAADKDIELCHLAWTLRQGFPNQRGVMLRRSRPLPRGRRSDRVRPGCTDIGGPADVAARGVVQLVNGVPESRSVASATIRSMMIAAGSMVSIRPAVWPV